MAGRPREAIRTWRGDLYACKIYHDDDAWPDAQQWRRLNESVGGHLLVDVPPGAVCHDAFHGPLGTVATYDAAQCAEVAAQFSSEQWTIDQPAAALWTYFTNDTCRPTTDPAEPCTLGYYPVYVILAQTLDHVRQGLLFAKAHNLRLVIRNTGHDFLGRSVGWGALVVNTHAFQDVAFVDAWDGPGDYDGPAVTVGAGVEGRPLLVQAHARSPPQTVVVGECPREVCLAVAATGP
ncbi:hypothetical protein VTK73DRAFT_4289 [Phialemonium thermophilum]|uniref:FAD linked oxidase N-terminal domain-containing protein n=1 Tax=Phialemonium thermophilum TaxID=223376 RepID=A0ABR3VAB8_9PEZI